MAAVLGHDLFALRTFTGTRPTKDVDNLVLRQIHSRCSLSRIGFTWREHAVERSNNVCKHSLRISVRINHTSTVICLEEVKHRSGFLVICVKPLLDRFCIVIGTPARLASLQQPLRHRVFRAVKPQHQLALCYLGFKRLSLIDCTRKPVKQEPELRVFARFNRLSQQRNGYALRHKLAFFHEGINLVALLAARRNLSS